MTYPAPQRTTKPGHISAVVLAMIFASIIAGWVTANQANAYPAVAPTLPAVLELRPPSPKPKLTIPAMIPSDATVEGAAAKLQAESRCLAEVVYYEARGESEAGQIAVAEVILQRLANGGHGHTICAVVYEGIDQTFCQFTFACDGSLDRPKTRESWRAAQILAVRLLAGQLQPNDETDGATYYHSASIRAVWDKKMVRIAQIGKHVFYKSPSSGPVVMAVAFRGALQQ